MNSVPRKHPRQARSRATVDAILDATARILARDGRDAVTTNAVAAAAGVSIGSLYQYYPNREAVLDALAHRHGHRIHDMVATCLDDPRPASLADAMERIVAAVFAAHLLDPHLHGALDGDFHSAHHHGHGHPSTKTAVEALLADLPMEVRGEVRQDAAAAPLVVAEMIHSLAHAALVHPAAHVDAATLQTQAAAAALAYLKAG